MSFSQALEEIKKGNKVCRSGWNGKNMFLLLMGKGVIGYSGNYSLLPFIAIKDVQGNLNPWQPSQTDMLSEDWEITQD